MLTMRIEKFPFRPFETASPDVDEPLDMLEEDILPDTLEAEENAETEAEAELEPIFFTEEQLEAARQEGWKTGFAEGEAAGKSQAASEAAAENKALEQEMLAVEKHIAQALTGLLEKNRQWLEDQRRTSIQLGQIISRKVAGSALEQNADAIVMEMVRQCGKDLMTVPTIRVFVHPGLVRKVRSKLEAMLGDNMDNDIQVTDDQSLAPFDCQVEWDTGSATRDTEQIWQEVDAILERILNTPESVSGTKPADTIEMDKVEAHMPPDPEAGQPSKPDHAESINDPQPDNLETLEIAQENPESTQDTPEEELTEMTKDEAARQ